MLEQGAIWICEDISDQRAARESLEASRAQLERAVHERTNALQSMNHVLEAEIGERKLAELRAQYLADHDALTNLPNRRLLEDRLTQALALSERNRKQTAVMFIDLDRFKAINDSAGHAAGDAVLKEVSQRLAKQLRTGDTICRIGGDEFVVVLPQFTRLSDLAHVSQKIIETVSQPVDVRRAGPAVSPSIGISIFPDDGRDAETLIRNADAAMYHAKETGRANYQFFTEQMNLAATRRVQLENDLRSSLQNQELRMFYQPVVEIATGRIAATRAAALAAPLARPDLSGRFHAARGGHRPHPADRRLGARRGMPLGCAEPARQDLTSASTSRRGSSRTRSSLKSLRARCRTRTCRRPGSSWKSRRRLRCSTASPRCRRCAG
jgi:diguanylate cyclase (GGDEF)-like protein